MPISSLIIRTTKDSTESVAKRLTTFKEASLSEVHGDKIVVVTETTEQTRDKDLWKEIEGIPGVMQCDLIYHNFEDEEGLNHGK